MKTSIRKPFKLRLLCAALALCLVGLAAFALAEEAPAKVQVGMIQLGDHPSLKIIEDTIRAKLEEYGVADRIELKYLNAQFEMSNLPTLANQLIGEGAKLLVPISTPVAQAAFAAAQGQDVDIIFTAVTDPIEAQLVTDLNVTDQRITGVSDAVPVDKVFELAQRLTPHFKTVGLLYNAGEANSVAGVKAAKAFCEANGISTVEALVSTTADVAQAANSLMGKADICFTSNDNTVAAAMPQYAQIGIDAKTPLYVGADTMVADGGLATVGIDYTVLGEQTARMIRDYLDGKTIAELPVEVIAETQPMVNSDTAAALGITVPEDVRVLTTGQEL